MRRGLLVAVGMALTACLAAQTIDNKISDAWLITRMAAKYHVSPRPLDKDMSAAIFSRMLDALDGRRILFTADDIRQLGAYRLTLDDQILNRRSDFVNLFISLYKQRLGRTDSLVDEIGRKPFDFTSHETLSVAEDSSWPNGRDALLTKIRKLLQYSVGQSVAAELAGEDHPTVQSRDSLVAVFRKRAIARMHRSIRRIIQSPLGIDNIVGNVYCQALASCYDPHTAYFPPDEKAAFESELGNKPLSFGLTLAEDDDGDAEIGKLQAGGPAFQSGNLHEGDKIISIRWDNKDPIDVSGAPVEEINRILGSEGGTRLSLTVKKADGTTREVQLEKQQVADPGEEDEKVTGFVLKGARNVGYISLPAFYSDWEDSRGINGCANDVAKEILRLKKEDISGLILDLRYNGGGSMQEAVELAGIFIDAGPVAQVKSREPKVLALKDVNRGTVYDGPLIILVNGGSASASEMVAGTLQDYHRALIVGSPTYGKATAQVVLPMDTTVDLANYNGKEQSSSYLKVTISQLYRVTGQTAQRRGVQPDVVLPDPPGAQALRESDEKYALPATEIAANKYYQPLPPLPVAAAEAIAQKAMDSSAFFTDARRPQGVTNTEGKDVSLNLDEMLAEEKKAAAEGTGAGDAALVKNAGPFTVSGKGSDDRKEGLEQDPYVAIAYLLITPLAK